MKHYEYLKGYKATDKDMKCHGFQFELGKWHKHKGEIELCKSGFHFCPHPSGPWNYYSDAGTRIFAVEARDVIEEYTPGADLKVVCREIRLIEEIKTDGHRNTGDSNTGHRNTGHRNTGDSNTGHRNTGHRNTGHRNTGDRNTGDSNTGDSNTGDRNTGDRNTGYGNTGDGNTGDGNTGYGNTGYGNATSFSAGFFCQKEPLVISFDKQTKLTRKDFLNKYPEVISLAQELSSDTPFDYAAYKMIPGWTLEKCKKLHRKHIEERKHK